MTIFVPKSAELNPEAVTTVVNAWKCLSTRWPETLERVRHFLPWSKDAGRLYAQIWSAVDGTKYEVFVRYDSLANHIRVSFNEYRNPNQSEFPPANLIGSFTVQGSSDESVLILDVLPDDVAPERRRASLVPIEHVIEVLADVIFYMHVQ